MGINPSNKTKTAFSKTKENIKSKIEKTEPNISNFLLKGFFSFVLEIIPQSDFFIYIFSGASIFIRLNTFLIAIAQALQRVSLACINSSSSPLTLQAE